MEAPFLPPVSEGLFGISFLMDGSPRLNRSGNRTCPLTAVLDVGWAAFATRIAASRCRRIGISLGPCKSCPEDARL
jgi:hypothetical protein